MELAKQNALGLKLVAASVIMGTAGAMILSSEAWGLSLPLYAAFLVAQVFLLMRFTGRRLSRTSIGLLVAAFAFSLCFLWRDAPELKLIDGFAVFALVGLAAFHATGKRLATAPIYEFAIGALGVWAVFVGDFFLLFFKDVQWASVLKTKGLAGTSAVVRGLLIAVPLLVVFGGLLVSADAGFQRFFSQLTQFDPTDAATEIGVGLACALFTGGLLRHLFLSGERPVPVTTPVEALGFAPGYLLPYPKEPFRLGATELGIILGSLNALFGLFVLIEAPYLFGGARHVLTTEHLSYADYARRGFFELVAVVGLAIPVLLGSHALVKSGSVAAERIWRGMSVVMVSLLFLVMQSAVQRMHLYVDLYSLTVERIYVLAALGWMGLTLLWFMATTVRGQSERFGFGAFGSLLVVILVVNAMNPDALIVRYNVAQSAPGKPVDGAYLRQLSADATPELILFASKLDEPTRTALATGWLADEKADRGHWRSWSISRGEAYAALDSHRAAIVGDSQKLVSALVPAGGR